MHHRSMINDEARPELINQAATAVNLGGIGDAILGDHDWQVKLLPYPHGALIQPVRVITDVVNVRRHGGGVDWLLVEHASHVPAQSESNVLTRVVVEAEEI